jgi:hypothetical protein
MGETMAAARKKRRKEMKDEKRPRSLMARLAALTPEDEKSPARKLSFRFWRGSAART